MNSANKTIEGFTAQFEQAARQHQEVIEDELSQQLSKSLPVCIQLFKALAAPNPEQKAQAANAELSMGFLIESLDSVMKKQGVDLGPFEMAAALSSAFAIYLRNNYQACDCKEVDCDHIPDISDILFTLAHGVTGNEKPV